MSLFQRTSATVKTSTGQVLIVEVRGSLNEFINDCKSKKSEILCVNKTAYTLKITKKNRKKIDRLVFVQELLNLLEAGLNPVEAIDIIKKKAADDSRWGFLEQIWSDLQSGLSLNQAFQKHVTVIGQLTCAAIDSGARSGDLTNALRKAAAQMQSSQAAIENIRSATIYPITVLISGLLILLFMITVIVPRFAAAGAFANNANLMVSTLVALGAHLSAHAHLYTTASIIIGALLYRWIKATGALQIALQIVGTTGSGKHIANNLFISDTFRSLATLLSTGAGYAEALQTCSETTPSLTVKKQLTYAITQIRIGKKMSATFRESGFCPRHVEQLLISGEESGRLPDMLHTAANMLEQDALRKISNYSKIAEPITLMIVGILVGGMVIAMYLPIFDLASSF